PRLPSSGGDAERRQLAGQPIAACKVNGLHAELAESERCPGAPPSTPKISADGRQDASFLGSPADHRHGAGDAGGAASDLAILRQSLQSNLRLQHLSRRTEAAYVYWTKRFVRFCGLRHPSKLGPADVRRFLTHLVVGRHLSAAT